MATLHQTKELRTCPARDLFPNAPQQSRHLNAFESKFTNRLQTPEAIRKPLPRKRGEVIFSRNAFSLIHINGLRCWLVEIAGRTNFLLAWVG
jgi:hypothetical protein